MPINPDFSALQAVITAKVEQVATNIDNKDLLIQMKALEAAVANLALTKVIAEGTFQQGQVTSTATTAINTLNTGVTNAQTTLTNIINTAEDDLDTIVTTATNNLTAAKDNALAAFNLVADQVLGEIDTLLDQLGSVNTQDIIDLVNNGLTTITTAANNANSSIVSSQNDALTIISSTGTTAINDINTSKDAAVLLVGSSGVNAIADINTARDAAIAAVSGAGNVTDQINLIRNDRWLGLNIFAPTNYLTN